MVAGALRRKTRADGDLANRDPLYQSSLQAAVLTSKTCCPQK
jgi:hypothetical protein